MSRGTKLQEMEQSKTAVNANAAPAQALPPEGSNAAGVKTPGNTPPFEDLGGPTPENYSPTNDSAKLNTPGKTIKQVSDVVTNRKPPAGSGNVGLPAPSATPVKTPGQSEETEVDTESVIEETPQVTDGVVQEVTQEEEYDIEEDVNALFGGEELSEEFKAKAKTIFEAAIGSKVGHIKETLESEYAEKIAEATEDLKVSLQERIDSYLEYVAEEWLTENELAVEAGLKTEMTESFLEGMKSLFEEHYVTIPEEKYDVIESMVDKLDDMETKLNEQIEKNIGLNKRLAESVADSILESVSDGLAATQKEKLASLSESVEFESEEEYREKLETLKESYFSRTPATKNESQTLSEGVDSTDAPVSAGMESYLRTLGAFKKS
jgi:hypothetical protein